MRGSRRHEVAPQPKLLLVLLDTIVTHKAVDWVWCHTLLGATEIFARAEASALKAEILNGNPDLSVFDVIARAKAQKL